MTDYKCDICNRRITQDPEKGYLVIKTIFNDNDLYREDKILEHQHLCISCMRTITNIIDSCRTLVQIPITKKEG